MHYTIINKAGHNLSSFSPNAVKPQLVYRKGDWITFRSKKAASEHLTYIQSNGVGWNLAINLITD